MEAYGNGHDGSMMMGPGRPALQSPPPPAGMDGGAPAGFGLQPNHQQQLHSPPGVPLPSPTGSVAAQVAAQSSGPYDVEAAVLGRALVAAFLRSTRTYDILPESAKVVVFDVAVPVKLAFYALVEHGACR
jgi:hypothetical protein